MEKPATTRSNGAIQRDEWHIVVLLLRRVIDERWDGRVVAPNEANTPEGTDLPSPGVYYRRAAYQEKHFNRSRGSQRIMGSTPRAAVVQALFE
jgi:hypothetical protein